MTGSKLTLPTSDPRWEAIYDQMLHESWDKIQERAELTTSSRLASTLVAQILREEYNVDLQGDDASPWATVTFDNEEHLLFLMVRFAGQPGLGYV